MPGFTPNFGIQYPCAGETIDPTVFQTFADDVEAALATVDALSAAALQRPRGLIRRTTAQSIAPGAMTAISWQVTEFSSGVTAGATGFTLTSDGIYFVSFNANAGGAPTSITSWAGEISVAGVVKYRRKISEFPAHLTPGSFNVAGLISGTAGNLVAHAYGWTGVAPNVDFFGRATINKISDL